MDAWTLENEFRCKFFLDFQGNGSAFRMMVCFFKTLFLDMFFVRNAVFFFNSKIFFGLRQSRLFIAWILTLGVR